MAALKYWIWLTALPGLTNHARLLLLDHFGSPENIYYAEKEELLLVEGLGSAQASLAANRSLKGQGIDLDKLTAQGGH